MREEALPRTIPTPLLVGFAVASIGGPLALVSLYFPSAAGGAIESAGLTALLAAGLFAFPLAVWLRYSKTIASAAGLAAFVAAAAGRRTAQVQAAIWTVSYFLYIPYTVTFIVYDVLPVVFPGLAPHRWWLELVIPIGIVGLVLLRLSVLLSLFAAAAAAQLVLMLVLGAVELDQVGASSASFASHGTGPTIAHGTANVALLFVCGSLPLFLGGEAKHGAAAIRVSLAVAFGGVVAYFVFAAFLLARVPAGLRAGELPGFAIANAYSGRTLAVVIGVASAVSVAALIVAEYVALSRLLHAFVGGRLRPLVLKIAGPFLLADALSLIDPERFYTYLLKPSLAALFLSQFIVFVVFPLYAQRVERRGIASAVAVAAVASGLMAFGFYTAVTTPFGAGT